jgi:hypothetical protein
MALVDPEGNVRVWGRSLEELPDTYVNKTIAISFSLESDVPVKGVNVSYVDAYGKCTNTTMSLISGDRLNGTWRAVVNPAMLAEETEDETSVSTRLEITTTMTLYVALPSETIEILTDSLPQMIPLPTIRMGSIRSKNGFLHLTPFSGLILLFSVTIPAIGSIILIRKMLTKKPKPPNT